MSDISPEDWKDWKQNKVTQAYLKSIMGQREEYKEGLVEGRVVEDVNKDIVIGRCQGIKDCFDFAVIWNNLFNTSIDGDKEDDHR